MLAHDRHATRQSREHLRTQISKATVAEDDDAIGALDRHLGRDLKRRGHGLGKHGDVVGQRVGHGVQVALRYGDQIRERTVVIQDADYRAVGTVRVQPLATGLTRPALSLIHISEPTRLLSISYAVFCLKKKKKKNNKKN